MYRLLLVLGTSEWQLKNVWGFAGVIFKFYEVNYLVAWRLSGLLSMQQ